MNRVIFQLAFRESGFFVVPVLVILLGYCLFQPAPLRHFDSVVLVLAMALGFGLGKFVFSDKPGVRPFLFSRAYSPKRFFLVRWIFGLSVIAATALVIAAMIAFGLRQGLQTALFRNGWFPMIRWPEMNVLWTFVVASLIVYHTTLFWVVRNGFLVKRKYTKARLWLRRGTTFLVAMSLLFGGVLLVSGIGMDIWLRCNYVTYVISPFLAGVLIPTAVVQTCLAPWFGIYCYRRQEIES
ncbi:MAG: hypothetical protein FWH27_13455 [Planctomycetaceae bacterium]|nr:hypothetical protein [Planctomycetaceae bacterium]